MANPPAVSPLRLKSAGLNVNALLLPVYLDCLFGLAKEGREQYQSLLSLPYSPC
jgi:hypothetical protein